MQVRLSLWVLLILSLSLLVGYQAVGKEYIKKIPLSDRMIKTEKGHDLIIFTPSQYFHADEHYDAGRGIDSVWLRMHKSEIDNPKFLADMIRFHHYILTEANPHKDIGQGRAFKFHSIGLSVQNVEHIIIEYIK